MLLNKIFFAFKAVCCSDGIHCCPHDTTCDVSHGKCIRQDGTSYPWLLKSPAMFHQVQVVFVLKDLLKEFSDYLILSQQIYVQCEQIYNCIPIISI